MYPVFATGLVVAGVAGRFAWRGEHQLLGFIRWTLVALLAFGAMGFAIGAMMLLRAGQQPDDPKQMARIVMEGIAEATNNVAAALMFTAITCLLVAVGQRRFPLPNPSAVVR